MKASQKNLPASLEFCLLRAKAPLVRRATPGQDRAIQSQTPTGIGSQFWQESDGSGPTPNGDSEQPASAASAFAGRAIAEFVAQPDFGGFSSCSELRTKKRNPQGRCKGSEFRTTFRLAFESPFSPNSPDNRNVK